MCTGSVQDTIITISMDTLTSYIILNKNTKEFIPGYQHFFGGAWLELCYPHRGLKRISGNYKGKYIYLDIDDTSLLHHSTLTVSLFPYLFSTSAYYFWTYFYSTWPIFKQVCNWPSPFIYVRGPGTRGKLPSGLTAIVFSGYNYITMALQPTQVYYQNCVPEIKTTRPT